MSRLENGLLRTDNTLPFFKYYLQGLKSSLGLHPVALARGACESVTHLASIVATSHTASCLSYRNGGISENNTLATNTPPSKHEHRFMFMFTRSHAFGK